MGDSKDQDTIVSSVPIQGHDIAEEDVEGLLTARPKNETDFSYLTQLDDIPQGRHLGLYSTIVLFVSRMLGSGIFATSLKIYENSSGSPFLFLLAWLLAALVAFSGLYIFLELGSLVPRSGGSKVFLEYIYTKPYMLAGYVFLAYSVLFGFSILNALVFGEYVLHSLGVQPSETKIRVVGLGLVYVVSAVHGYSVHHGIKVQNFLGALKLFLLLVIAVTSVYLTFFPQLFTHIEPQLTWGNFFKSSTKFSFAKFTSAILEASFSFSGWGSVHTVTNEVIDPERTLRIAGPLSLTMVFVAYFLMNIAYLVVIPASEFVDSGKLVGSILFEKVFGERIGRYILSTSIALSSGGNVFVVIYTISRLSQEVFREGHFPYSRFMASNWPFGSPLPTILLSAFITTLIVFLPKADVYNYIISLEGYMTQIFLLFTALGIFILRKREPELRAPIRASIVGTFFVILMSVYLIVSPFVSKSNPNPVGLESWPSYSVISVLTLSFLTLCWALKFYFFPWLYSYRLVREDVILEDGLTMKEWQKIPSYRI